MHLLQEPAIAEDLQVAPDRHVGDAELAGQLRDPDRTVLADPLEDPGLALAGEQHAAAVHRRRSLASARLGDASFLHGGRKSAP